MTIQVSQQIIAFQNPLLQVPQVLSACLQYLQSKLQLNLIFQSWLPFHIVTEKSAGKGGLTQPKQRDTQAITIQRQGKKVTEEDKTQKRPTNDGKKDNSHGKAKIQAGKSSIKGKPTQKLADKKHERKKSSVDSSNSISAEHSSSSGSEVSENSSDQSQSSSSSGEDVEMKDESKIKSAKQEEEKSSPVKEQSCELYNRIIQSEKLEKRLSVKIPESISEAQDNESQVCQICYQSTKYPEDPEASSEDQSVDNIHSHIISDSKALYILAFCKTCYVPAHWNCLGTDTQLIEYETKNKKVYYFFECDRCKYKALNTQNSGKYNFSFTNTHHGSQTCIACDKEEGLLKAFKVDDSDRMQIGGENATQYIAFYHPICAMSFSDKFSTVVTSDSVSLCLKNNTLNNPLIQQRRERTLSNSKKTSRPGVEQCSICKSQMGLFVQDKNNASSKSIYAHVYCILSQKEIENAKMQWSYQVLLDKDNNFTPVIKVSYQEGENLKYCQCDNPEYQFDMVLCDYCTIWYHFKCADNYVSGVNKFQCIKCSSWRNHLQNNLLDIVCKRKTYAELLDEDQTYWKGFDSLCNYVEDEDLAILTPVIIFEHLLIIKAWHVLTGYLLNEVAHEDLISYHITEASYLFPSIDTEPITNDFAKRKALVDRLIKEASDQTTLKDLVSGDGKTPKSQLTSQQKKSLIEHNTQAGIKAQEIEKRCISEAKLINQSVIDLHKITERSKVLQDAVKLLQENSKPQLQEVRSICQKIDEQDMTEGGFQSVETLKQILSEYDQWVATTMQEFKRTMPEEEKVRERIKEIKVRKVGFKRQEARFKMFKEYLQNKTTIELAHQMMDNSHKLKVDTINESLYLEQLIQVIEDLEKKYEKYEKNPSQFKVPMAKAHEMLIEACCYPIKSTKIDRILETWNKSMIWQIKAKSFLQEKLNEEQEEEMKTIPMEVDEGDKPLQVAFTQRDFIWTVDRAIDLQSEVKQAQDQQRPLYIDQKLLKQVKDKVHAIQSLKRAIKVGLTEEHEIKELKGYQKQLEDMETVDFSSEISKLREKIKLIIDVKNVIENESKMKQSIEMLELIQNRVNELAIAENNSYPIAIKWDMKMFLQSKVTAAKDLKREFQELLQNQYQNTFSKNMIPDLKAIVNRADQEYSVDMKKEQRIIDNIPFSEEWFLNTYDRLKKVVGKTLHQVDFKDFVQLSTVLTDEKECVQLLKGLTKTPDHLVGAAQNLWRSISGVKWLFEVKRLLKIQGPAPTTVTANEEIELKKVVELDLRAREILEISYEKEQTRGHIYSKIFGDFKRIVDCIRLFDEKFGTYQKLIRTLESNQERLDVFKQECESLTHVLQSHKITSQSGELDLLSKIHTYIDFLQQYKQLTSVEEEHKDNTIPKISYEKAMLLQQLAREKQIPEDLSILKRLKESVLRFEKFQREYSDYKRYRERVLKRSKDQKVGELVETRFTCQFVKKLIEESQNLQIEQPTSSLEDQLEDAYFNKEMLLGDLAAHDQWQLEAEAVLSQLEDDEVAVSSDAELRGQFDNLKLQMSSLPLYDKELFIRMQVFDWLYSSNDMLEQTSSDLLSIGSWDSKIKQADAFLQQLQQHRQLQLQTSGDAVVPSSSLIKNLKNHSIYQRLLWEVEQARSVQEFVQTQKTNQKALAAKYHLNDQLRQQQFNQNTFFRNKHSRAKIDKMLEQARRSKIDLQDEIRSLDVWLKESDKYEQQYNSDTLFTENSFERLKEIAKILYLSPIDQSTIYLKLKPSLETAESIKLDLKRIVQEHEQAQQMRANKDRPVKRLRFSRVSYSLQIYEKECKIPGIKEIDTMIAKVAKSKQILSEIQGIIDEITQITDDKALIKERIDQAKRLLQDMEIDMEKKEIEVRRQLFDLDLRHVLFAGLLAECPEAHQKRRKRIEYEEFKQGYEREFNLLREHLIYDSALHGKFLELKNQVNDFARKIQRVATKDELHQLEAEITQECPLIDFTQSLSDKDALLVLGKREVREDSSEEEEHSIASSKAKRRKLNTGAAAKKEVPESASNSSSEGSSSSGSNSGSSSSSSSSDGQHSSSSDESSDSEESSKGNIAQNRSRRTIVPNMSSDFIYDNSTIAAQQKIASLKEQKSGEMPEDEENEEMKDDSASMQEEEKKALLKKAKKAEERRLKEKKRKMAEQLEEHRRQKKSQEPAIHQQVAQGHFSQARKLFKNDTNQGGLSLGAQLAQDTSLMNSLQAFKNKIREQSRTKIKEHFEIKDTVFATLSPQEILNLTTDIEAEIFEKHPEADSYYRKRISDICENLKFLKNYKDISDLIAIKKALSMGKLLQNHHAFKEDVVKLDQKVKERRQQLKEMSKKAAPMKKVEEKPKEEAPSEKKAIVKSQDENTPSQQMQQDSDDVESYDSNPALFSDEEEESKLPSMTALQSIIQQAKQSQKASTPGRTTYDPSQTPPPQSQTFFDPQMMYNMPVRHYNPQEIIQGRQFNRYQARKPSEPILYDPTKVAKASVGTRNSAPVGSLLRVWEGALELAKDNQIKCQVYSSMDIHAFQELPELPNTLPLKGKAKLQDVITHFLRLRRDKRLIKGWVTRKNCSNQENNDRYARLFEELDQTQRSALFNVFHGITIYLVPITSKTREFCLQMGLDPESFKRQQYEEGKIAEDVRSLEDETHCYAFLSQIKQDFPQKTNFLNPDVLRVAIVQHVKQYQSPITSDEETRRAPLVQNVKMEDISRQQVSGMDPRLAIQSRDAQIKRADDSYMNEDEDDVDIDELIQGFKNHEYNIASIQEKLMTVIHKVSGEKEAKLTQFLQELIQTLNNPQQSRESQRPESSMIKSEETLDPASVGYSIPVGMMGSSIPSMYRQQQQQFGGNQLPFARQAVQQQPIPGQYNPYRQQMQFMQQQGIRPQQYFGQGAIAGVPPIGLYPSGARQGQFGAVPGDLSGNVGMMPQIRPPPQTGSQMNPMFDPNMMMGQQPMIRPPPQMNQQQQQQNMMGFYQGGQPPANQRSNYPQGGQGR